MLTDGREPRHTHRPDAMERSSRQRDRTSSSPITGSRARRSRPGVETIRIADVNDPALLVARARGRTEHVLVMDDHVQPDDYWPGFRRSPR